MEVNKKREVRRGTQPGKSVAGFIHILVEK